MSRPGSGDAHDPARLLALWTGVLAGPILTLVLLQTNYVLSYVSCETKQTWFLHVTTVAAVVLTAAACAWACQAGRGAVDLPDAQTAPLSPGTGAGRTRWMAHAAVASTVWFVIVMIALSIPSLVLSPCQ